MQVNILHHIRTILMSHLIPLDINPKEAVSILKKTINSPIVIDKMYRSMSQLIDDINVSNVLLYKQIEFIKNDIIKIKNDFGTGWNNITTIEKKFNESFTECIANMDGLSDKIKIVGKQMNLMREQIIKQVHQNINKIEIRQTLLEKQINEIKCQSSQSIITQIKDHIQNIIHDQIKYELSQIPDVKKLIKDSTCENKRMIKQLIDKIRSEIKYIACDNSSKNNIVKSISDMQSQIRRLSNTNNQDNTIQRQKQIIHKMQDEIKSIHGRISSIDIMDPIHHKNLGPPPES